MSKPSLGRVYAIVAVASVIAVMYAVMDRQAPPIVSLFIGLAPIIAVGTWFRHYLRESQVALPYDFGYFFMLGWPVLVPVYAKRIRGVRTGPLIWKLYGLAVAPKLIGVVVGSALGSLPRAG